MLRLRHAFPTYPALFTTTLPCSFRAAYPDAVVFRATFSMWDRDVTVLVRTTAFRILGDIRHEQDWLASDWDWPQSISQDGPWRIDTGALRRLLPVLQRVLSAYDPVGRLDLTARAALAFYKAELQRQVTVDVHRLLLWFFLMGGTRDQASESGRILRPQVLGGVGISSLEEYVVTNIQLPSTTIPLAWNVPPPVVWRDEPVHFERVRTIAANNTATDASTDADATLPSDVPPPASP